MDDEAGHNTAIQEVNRRLADHLESNPAKPAELRAAAGSLWELAVEILNAQRRNLTTQPC